MVNWRMPSGAWVIFLLFPGVLWPQSSSQDKNADLAERQTLVDEIRHSNRQTDGARMQAAVEMLQALQADTDRLNKLSQELKAELAVNNPGLLSEESLKRNVEMEKLIKRIKSTMRKAAGR